MIALKSQIPMGQKFALAGIFSLDLIITVFSIIRFVLNSPTVGWPVQVGSKHGLP